MTKSGSPVSMVTRLVSSSIGRIFSCISSSVGISSVGSSGYSGNVFTISFSDEGMFSVFWISLDSVSLLSFSLSVSGLSVLFFIAWIAFPVRLTDDTRRIYSMVL